MQEVIERRDVGSIVMEEASRVMGSFGVLLSGAVLHLGNDEYSRDAEPPHDHCYLFAAHATYIVRALF